MLFRSAKLHILGVDANSASLLFERQSDNIYGPYVHFRKTRASEVAAQSNEYLGGLSWHPGNGQPYDFAMLTSAIWAYAESSTTGSEAGGIDFLTTQDGEVSGIANVRMRIKANGNVGVGTTDPQRTLEVKNALGNQVRLSATNTFAEFNAFDAGAGDDSFLDINLVPGTNSDQAIEIGRAHV